jgi:hypothetical protein
LLIEYRPHSRKEAKLDTKTKLYQLNELAGKDYLSKPHSLLSICDRILWKFVKP